MSPSIQNFENRLERFLKPGDILTRRENVTENNPTGFEKKYEYLGSVQINQRGLTDLVLHRGGKPINYARVREIQDLGGVTRAGEEFNVRMDSDAWTGVIPKEERTDLPSLKER